MAYVKPTNITDYASEINKAMSAGASAQTIAELQAARQAKIKGDASLAKYNTNDFNNNVNTYIAQNLPQANYTPQGNYLDAGATGQAKQAITQQQDIWKTYNALAKAAADPGLAQEYTAQRDAAHTTAEQIRNSLGYSGGADGSQNIPTAAKLAQPPFDMTQATAVKPPTFNGATSGLLNGYLNYDFNNIKQIYEDATKAQYEMLNKQYQTTENKFYDNMFNTQNTAMDVLRRNRNQAVASGASQGIQAANELLTMLGLNQETVAGATELAQQRNLLKDKEAAAMAQVPVDALQTANTAGATAAGIASNIYAADTQFAVGQLDAIARYQQALKDLEGVIYNADSNYNSNIYTANKNYAGTTYAANKNYNAAVDAAKQNAAAYQNSQNAQGANGNGAPNPNSAELPDVLARADYDMWAQLYRKDKDPSVTKNTLQKEWVQLMVNQNIPSGKAFQEAIGKAGVFLVDSKYYDESKSDKDIKRSLGLSDNYFSMYHPSGVRFIFDTKPVKAPTGNKSSNGTYYPGTMGDTGT